MTMSKRKRSPWCSIDRSLARSSDRSLDRSIARSLARSLDRSIDRSIARSLDRSLDRSIARSLDRSLEPSRLLVISRVCRKMHEFGVTVSQTFPHHPMCGFNVSHICICSFLLIGFSTKRCSVSDPPHIAPSGLDFEGTEL